MSGCKSQHAAAQHARILRSSARFQPVITHVRICCRGDGVSGSGLLCTNSHFSPRQSSFLSSEFARMLEETFICGFMVRGLFLSVFIQIKTDYFLTKASLIETPGGQTNQNFTFILRVVRYCFIILLSVSSSLLLLLLLNCSRHFYQSFSAENSSS